MKEIYAILSHDKTVIQNFTLTDEDQINDLKSSNMTFIKLADLPEGTDRGWYLKDGVWTDPNPPEMDVEDISDSQIEQILSALSTLDGI